MKRFLAAMLGIFIFCLSLAALADNLDDEFAEAFDSFRFDPFAGFDDPFPMDEDPGSADDSFEDFADESWLDTFGNAFTSFDGGTAEDEEDPFAEPDDPAPSDEFGSGSLQVNIGGETLNLNFDPSPSYSSIVDHLVQAAFYTYGADTGNLYEMFLTFPDSVRSGDTITPEYAMTSAVDSSVVLLISSAEQDTYYVASQQSTTGPYPETSNYSLHFDTVTPGAASTTFYGNITADLVSFNQSTGQIDKTLHIEGATFIFTIASSGQERDGDTDPGEGDSDPGDGGVPFDDFTDLPTPAPMPTPTLAPDFRKV